MLKRYPHSKSSDLKAWDNADVYLINTVKEMLPEPSNLCILNDNFGALTLGLAEHHCSLYSDSWLSHKAIHENLKDNHQPEQTIYSDLNQMICDQEPVKLVLGRVPKSNAHLIDQLIKVREWVTPNTKLLLAGMDKHLSRNQFELLSKFYGPSRFYPGVKKARIWESISDKTITNKMASENGYSLEEFGLNLTSLANVFSSDALDIGSRFFLENIDRLPSTDSVADLACGNGVLGLCYLIRNPAAKLHFFDESFQAIESAEINWRNNFTGEMPSFNIGDGLKSFSSNNLSLVMCNPPFHQQHTISKQIALNLFNDSFRKLKSSGELWIVANRHLNYHTDLKRIFGNCETVIGNPKFVILKSIKN